MTTPDMSQIEQERLLFRYSMALERGDFEMIATILETAAYHPSLNRMIQELDMAYSTDSDSDPEIHGEYTMAQLTRPLILPQKQKHIPQRRSFLLFPFAAMIALALVGLSLISLSPPPANRDTNQGLNQGVYTATPTPVPYVRPATNMMPTEVPSQVGSPFPPTVPPFNGNPTLVPMDGGLTFTPTSAGPTQPPTIVPPLDAPTLIPGGNASIIVPIYCEGITRGEPETHLFTRPFIAEGRGTIVGLYAPNTLVTINDVATDEKTSEIWYYIGDSNSAVQRGDQGWTNSLNIELMWNCAEELNLLAPTPDFTPTPFSMDSSIGTETATPFPMQFPIVTETATPFQSR